MVKFTGGVTRESIIDMEAKVVKAPEQIKNCSQKDVELQILKVNFESHFLRFLFEFFSYYFF